MGWAFVSDGPGIVFCWAEHLLLMARASVFDGMGIRVLLVGDRRRNEGSWIGWAFVFDGLGLRFDGVGLCFGWAGVFVVGQKTKATMREDRGQNERRRGQNERRPRP